MSASDSAGTAPTRPKRALLSLRSMLVMCSVLAFFVWAITRERTYWEPFASTSPDREVLLMRVNCCGFPWTYRTENHFDALRTVSIHEVDRPEKVLTTIVSAHEVDSLGEVLGTRVAVSTPILLLNLAVALAVSIALALASERFVFSAWRPGRSDG